LVNLLISFSDSSTKQSFIDDFAQQYGIHSNKVQVAEYGDFIAVEDVPDEAVSLIRQIPGVDDVSESVQFQPFDLAKV
jgi:hypothetical protein